MSRHHKVSEHYWLTQDKRISTRWELAEENGRTAAKYLMQGADETAEQVIARATDTATKREETWAQDVTRTAESRRDAAIERAERDAAKTAPRATPKQVDYILRLIADGAHEEGGYFSGPTTRREIAAMTRRDASTYIDSLTGNY